MIEVYENDTLVAVIDNSDFPNFVPTHIQDMILSWFYGSNENNYKEWEWKFTD